MFVELTRGRSFRGLAQYCLHDVEEPSSERVAFVQTRNLATDDPQVAWRIMAARHYLQDELKEQAGVARGGAQNGKPVGHLVISWRRDEADAEQLNAQSMVQAAAGALRAIGASGHQALIIGHNDTAHPHCHVIINLIGDDGRLKKNWKEKEKLSKFALKREIEIHGEPIVEAREQNWLDREAGESPPPVRKRPRQLYELDKAATQCEQVRSFAVGHLRSLASLEQSRRAQQERHRRHSKQFQEIQRARKQRIEQTTTDQIRQARSEVRKSYRTRWTELLRQQRDERLEFVQNEDTLKGSLSNALRLINWKQLLGRRSDPAQPGLSDAFQLLTSEAVRRERMRQRQDAERNRLRQRQYKEEAAWTEKILHEKNATLRSHAEREAARLEALKQKQARSRKLLQDQQKRLSQERAAVLDEFRLRELLKKRQQVLDIERNADPPPPDSQLEAESGGRKRTRRPRKERAPRLPRVEFKDLTREASRETLSSSAEPSKDDFEERMRTRFNERSRDRNMDRDR